MNKNILANLVMILSINALSLTVTADDAKTIKICRNMMTVLRPKGIKTSDCFNQAKAYLKEKKVAAMIGSYQAYFALSNKDQTQKVCRDFLQDVVTTSQKNELDDAKALFENDRAQSLDQAFYSYQTCDDKRIAAQAAPTKENAKAPSQATQ